VRETRARARVSFVTRQNRRTFNHQFMNERLSSFRWKFKAYTPRGCEWRKKESLGQGKDCG